jgi:hypothetical protein
MSDFCSTSFSGHSSALLHPHTPRGVVVEQSYCSTCSTLLHHLVEQVEQLSLPIRKIAL